MTNHDLQRILKTPDTLSYEGDRGSLFSWLALAERDWQLDANATVQFMADPNGDGTYDIQSIAKSSVEKDGSSKRLRACEEWPLKKLTRDDAAQILYTAIEESNALARYQNNAAGIVEYPDAISTTMKNSVATPDMSVDDIEALQYPYIIFTPKEIVLEVLNDDSKAVLKDAYDKENKRKNGFARSAIDEEEPYKNMEGPTEQDVRMESEASIVITGMTFEELMNFSVEEDPQQKQDEKLYKNLSEKTKQLVREAVICLSSPRQFYAVRDIDKDKVPYYAICAVEQDYAGEIMCIKPEQGRLLQPVLQVLENLYRAYPEENILADKRHLRIKNPSALDYSVWRDAAPILDKKFCLKYGWE